MNPANFIPTTQPIQPKLTWLVLASQTVETVNKDGPIASVRATDDDEENTDATKLTYTLEDFLAIRTGCEGNSELFVVETDVENNLANIKANQDLQGCWGDYNITLKATDSEAPNNEGTGMYKVGVRVDDTIFRRWVMRRW